MTPKLLPNANCRNTVRVSPSLVQAQMGIRVMDSNDQERERGITILAKVRKQSHEADHFLGPSVSYHVRKNFWLGNASIAKLIF